MAFGRAADGGGFTGAEKRLTMSRRTAYRLLDVHKQFGGYESVPLWHTLPRRVLYLLAAPSTPDEVREETIERVAAGERLTLAEVKEKIEAAQETVRSEAQAEIQRLTKARDDVAREVEERLRQENLIVSPEELEAFCGRAREPDQADLRLT